MGSEALGDDQKALHVLIERTDLLIPDPSREKLPNLAEDMYAFLIMMREDFFIIRDLLGVALAGLRGTHLSDAIDDATDNFFERQERYARPLTAEMKTAMLRRGLHRLTRCVTLDTGNNPLPNLAQQVKMGEDGFHRIPIQLRPRRYTTKDSPIKDRLPALVWKPDNQGLVAVGVQLSPPPLQSDVKSQASEVSFVYNLRTDRVEARSTQGMSLTSCVDILDELNAGIRRVPAQGTYGTIVN